MGAGADAQKRAITPIDEIVPRLRSRTCVVGNLVGGQAVGLGQGLRDLIEARGFLGLGHDEFAGGVQEGELRAFLDGELVEREMIGGEGERLGQLRLPGRRALPRPRIDEIERGARKRRAGEREGGAGFRRAVPASERLEVGVVQRLKPDRDAVDAGGAIIGEAAGIGAGRVGLQRDLDVGGEGKELRRRVDDAPDRRARHQRGRAAAEEDRGEHGPRVEPCGQRLHLADQRAGIVQRIDAAGADMGVEVAIGTLGGAERPVRIERKAPFGRGFSHRTRPRGAAQTLWRGG